MSHTYDRAHKDALITAVDARVFKALGDHGSTARIKIDITAIPMAKCSAEFRLEPVEAT